MDVSDRDVADKEGVSYFAAFLIMELVGTESAAATPSVAAHTPRLELAAADAAQRNPPCLPASIHSSRRAQYGKRSEIKDEYINGACRHFALDRDLVWSELRGGKKK